MSKNPSHLPPMEHRRKNLRDV